MKLNIKLFLIALLIHSEAFAQVSDWYHNMEKYWFYRYRLVNDFMMIGTDCGNSIPASKRRYTIQDANYADANVLEWGDATQDLGHYISTLAIEYRMLNQNNMGTRRTKEELFDALDAFDRLDQNAEGYCQAMSTGNIASAFPCNSPGWTTPFNAALNNGTTGPFNGFFIRDDVPFDVNLYHQSNFVTWNYDHFNRPGIVSVDPVGEVRSAFCAGLNIHSAAWENNWPNNGCPKYPREGNMDQFVELVSGMGLTVKLLGQNETYQNQNIRHKAMDAVSRIATWVPKPPMPNFLEEAAMDLAFHNYQTNWLYKNPLTMRCVYGTAQDAWATGGQCEHGGALVFAIAPALAKAMWKICALNDPQYTSKGLALMLLASPYNAIFQASQLAPQNNQGSLMFPDEMVVFANNWYDGPVCAYCPPLGPNTSWKMIKYHARQKKLSTPHIPLMYRLFQAGPGMGVDDFHPENHGWWEYTYPFGFTYHPHPSIEQLLNSAPNCGTCFYGDPNYVGEWTGPDRLGHFAQRNQFDWHVDAGENADYNGLDYMMLFNLYADVKEDYLQFLINPYYMEDFDVTYPDAYNNNIGSNTHKLKLNWLEYLSAKNHITNTGNVTYRGAKVIDLEPGFRSDYGSYFFGYIQDYTCHGNDPIGYTFAEDNNNPTEYDMSHMPFAARPDDTSAINPVEDNSDITEEEANQKFKLSLEAIVNSSDDPDILDYIKAAYGLNRDGTWAKNNALNEDSSQIDYTKWVEIYPNPTNTTSSLEYELFDPAKVSIRLTNALGQDFSQLVEQKEVYQSSAGKYETVIHSEQLSAGLYYCYISVGKQMITKKLTVY